ncbi:MAG: glycosyltransferase family 39 protein [Flavobacteriales bacterium]
MDRRHVLIAWSALLVTYALGACVPVMDVDAAQYASMSAQMARDGHWLQLFDRDLPYLDKPPLLFWLSAASVKLFGVLPWAYKLPSILFALAGCWGVFKFTRLHYDTRTAHTAALVYGSSVAMLQMTNDVRCDTLLTSNVILAIWAGMAWLKDRRTLHLLLAAVFIALAMLAKGPIGLAVPALALGGHVAITGQWRALRDARLLLVPLSVGLLLLPMCFGLYRQHGAHGISFYFWEQSFGRITGSNRWRDDSSGLFFLHTFLWVALPWTLFALFGLVTGLLGIFRRKRALREYASICGVVLTVIALSFSHYKLPHYLFVIMPLVAVVVARALTTAHARLLALVQLAVAALIGALALWLAFVSLPATLPVWAFVLVASVVPAAIAYARSSDWARGFWPTQIVAISAALLLNGQIYPSLLKYQAGSEVGNKVRELGIPQADLMNLATLSRALDFHAGYSVPWLRDVREANAAIRPGLYIYCDSEGRDALLRAGHPALQEWTFPAYPVQVLTLDFLRPERQATVVKTNYLLRF